MCTNFPLQNLAVIFFTMQSRSKVHLRSLYSLSVIPCLSVSCHWLTTAGRGRGFSRRRSSCEDEPLTSRCHGDRWRQPVLAARWRSHCWYYCWQWQQLKSWRSPRSTQPSIPTGYVNRVLASISKQHNSEELDRGKLFLIKLTLS